MIYCKIQDNKIINKRDTKDDQLLESKMVAQGWLPYIDNGAPSYDKNTQSLAKEDKINKKSVTVKYTVTDLVPEQVAAIKKEQESAQKEKLIQQEIRQMAIDSLKAKGKLTAEGNTK